MFSTEEYQSIFIFFLNLASELMISEFSSIIFCLVWWLNKKILDHVQQLLHVHF